MNSWSDKPTPAEALEQWHDQARQRDETAVAAGPDDDSESNDPYHPWRGAE
jgi:hypothetical protein